MSGLEVVQVVASVSELVRLSYLFYQFLGRLSKADENAKESLKRIKQLHEVAYGVKLALERRQEQAGKGNIPRGEEVVWKYLESSINRCHKILLRIRSIYTPFSVESQPTFVEKALRQIRFEAIKKDELNEEYSALSTQLQALQLNTQTLNTFISIGTGDKLDAGKEEILDAIARLERLHSKCSSQLSELVQRREDIPPTSPRTKVPAIGVTSPTGVDELVDDDEDDVENDIDVMQGALAAAYDLISTYDPSGQSVIERVGTLDLDDSHSLDSGLGSEEQDVVKPPAPAKQNMSARRRSSAAQATSAPRVKHVHGTSQRVLDGCIVKYQARVEQALRKDQNHMAETDLQQLMAYAEERKQKYSVDYDKVQMQEQLAEIYKRQGKHSEVFAVLEQLLPSADSAENHTLENSRHFQLIAETYYELWEIKEKKDDLYEAQDYALTAFTIREDLEATETLLQQSAALLARIYEALDSPVEAEVYRDMFLHVASPPPTPGPRQSIVEREVSIASGSLSGNASSSEKADVNKELVRAIKDRNVSKVRQFLQSGEVNVDYRTKQFQTPLHCAFEKSKGNESIPLALLEHGFAVDADDADGRTVLHCAAASGDAAMIRLAISRDAGKEAKDKYRLTPLLVAVKEGPNFRERQAILEAIEALLDEGCDPKARDQDGWTVLHHAAHNSAALNGSPKAGVIANAILELLLRRLARGSYAALEATDKGGYTPLLRVAGAGEPFTVAMLLDAGAEVNARNGAERSALYLAMVKKPDLPKYANVIKTLVDRGAYIDECELAKEDYKKFKHLLVKSDNASLRRLSTQTRRASESKRSVHQIERTTSVGNEILSSQVIPERRHTVDEVKAKKGGIRKLFGKSGA